MDWLDLLAIQGTLKSLLQHHGSKASILQHSAFFIVQLSHPYMTTGKTTALIIQTFVGKVMSLLFNMLSRFVKAPISLWTVTEAMKLKEACSLEKKSYGQPRQHVIKPRHHFANKGLSSQNYGFPAVMYGCEGWTVKKAEC